MASLALPKNLNKSYIVCSTGRSGSTLLCKTLEKTGCCGKPQEYFHLQTMERLQIYKDSETFINYCNSILKEGLTEDGTFGIKMHWWQMYNFFKVARKFLDVSEKTDLEILNYIFPNPNFIYIWRRDLTQQAVSTVIALQTKQWAKPKQKENKNNDKAKKINDKLKFQPLKIYRWEQGFADQNRRWREFLTDNNLDYREVVYEDFVANFDQQITEVIDYLGVDQKTINDKIEPPLQRQASEINQKFLQRYKSIPKLVTKVAYKLNQKLN